MKPATLSDGTVVDRASEAWRMECEARWIAGIPTLERRRGYLAKVAKQRGPDAFEKLAAAVKAVWAARKPETAEAA